MSESDAAGRLISIPGIVEAEATKPSQKPSGVCRLVAKGFKTGFLDIVELNMANTPIVQSIQNMLSLLVFNFEFKDKPASKSYLKKSEFSLHFLP